MKKFICLIVFMIFASIVYADSCNVTCPSETIQIVEKGSIISKITGVNFLTKKIIESAIVKELKDELNSEFKAELNIFNLKRLKNGEFKSLNLYSDNFRYKAMSVSDFKAETICNFNKVIYKNKKVYFPYDLPLKFNAYITNQDIKNIIASDEFQRQLERSSLSINGFKTFEVLEPAVEIKNGELFFSIPINTFLSSKSFVINLNSNIEVENNKIVLKSTTFSSNSNIINVDILGSIVNEINPVAFQIDSINSKYCKIYITNAKMQGNIIKVEGTFIINKNYER